MLTELYEYAIKKGLTARPGFKPKQVKAYICLSADGQLLGVEPREKNAESVYSPDIGSAANGTRFCNPLVEKAKIPLCIVEDEKKDANIPTKHAFYLSMLKDGTADEPRFATLLTALSDDTRRLAMQEELTAHKLKPADPIGFKIDGEPLEESENYLSWWDTFRVRFAPASTAELPRCLITGELEPALATVPKVSGLIGVGGHTAGDAFLCFDKDSFQSFGLKKSANAPVSENAMSAVNAALTELIAKAPVLGNAKMLHWYSDTIPPEEDVFSSLLDGEEEEPLEDEQPALADPLSQERSAMRSAHTLLTAVEQGAPPTAALSATYYILPLSGANGRMMVRGWYQGSYESLYRNVAQWFDDLRIVTWDGKGLTKPPKFKALGIRLLKPGGNPQKVWSRMDEELPNLLGRLFYSAVQGTAIPDEVANRVLRWIRSAILQSDEDGKNKFEYETLAFQLLKAWLCRRQRIKGEVTMLEDHERAPGVAYCCGQLMATYVALQKKATDVNVGVAERYYTAASSSPAFVIGKLAQLAQYHLSKLDGGLAVYFEKKLSEIYCAIGERPIPSVMNAEQQTEFALGYYQQRAALYAPKSVSSEN